jgi:DNA-binding NtrC family response regulator
VPSDPQSLDAGSWDVLVVDDEQVVRAGVRRILEEDGLRVATVRDAASVLAHPALDSCRLVLCDLVLGEHSGIELITRLKQDRPRLPVVLITGYAGPEQERLALAAGADAFLAKPFDDSELLGIVRTALASAERAAQEDRS